MKATLEFNLDEPDEEMAYQRCIKSKDMAMALWEITHNTKKKLEWDMENKDITKYDALEMVFDKFYEILKDNNIDTEQLID
jgi:hypothetical protein